MRGMNGIAVLLAVAALGVAAYGLARTDAGPTEFEGRLDALEDQLARIEARLAVRARAAESAPTLMGHRFATSAEAPVATHDATPGSDGASEPRAGNGTLALGEPDRGGTTEAIQKLVDEAVEKKTAQIQTMRNKKPSVDVFAKTLELTDDQRRVVERSVVQAQLAIKDILEIRAEDGTNFMDELVEVMADGMANPGKDPGRGQRLFGRLLSEKIPGSDQTYAARVETVKGRLRNSFKKDWSPEQFAAFQAWQMDPTEVQGIQGSPWKEVEKRVIERAQELGAEIPK